MQKRKVFVSSTEQDCSGFDGEPLINNYKFGTCSAGLLRAGVKVNGDVTPCLLLRNVSVGNLYKETWGDIWNKSKERYLSMNVNRRQCTVENLVRKEELLKSKSKY